MLKFFLNVASLHSKEDGMRDDSGIAIKHLAHQCSDPDALEQLLHHLVGILNGKDKFNTCSLNSLPFLAHHL